jgi:tripartite-type tricarboxylate transporter receptor subunit TctC
LRALAAATEKHLGRPIIIENRAGASTTLAAQMAARASADGYTLVQIGRTVFRLPLLRNTTYDPAKDFTYIIAVTGYTYGVVVKTNAPWKTFQVHAADKRGTLAYGTFCDSCDDGLKRRPGRGFAAPCACESRWI